MKNTTVYDVLVVYTDGVATSASSKKTADTKPFSPESLRADYNDCYAYFLNHCRKNNIKAAFTTSKDLSKDGLFNTHWTYSRNKWKKVTSPCYAPLIFDKFSPINKKQRDRRISLFSNLGIEPFNSHEIFSLFFDKQKTYDVLNKFTIPTVTVKNNTGNSINKAVLELQKLVDLHPGRDDFSRKIVVKDRFGAGGNNIFCTKLKKRRGHIQDIIDNNHGVSFILQPFTEFEQGYGFKKRSGFVDIRVIYLGKKIIQAYVRTAAKDDFRCNMHQGGNVEYITKRDIPKRIINMADEVVEQLDDENSLIALDFIVSNNGNPYLMEGNSGPGLNWSLTIKQDEKYTKKLIREIVRMLALRITPTLDNLITLRKEYSNIVPISPIMALV